jgi:hypothetical protein
VTETAAGLLAGRGPLPVQQLAGELLPLAGHGWSRNGQPLTDADMRQTIYGLAPTWQALDLVNASSPTWAAGASARTLLPGATLLAEVWSW